MVPDTFKIALFLSYVKSKYVLMSSNKTFLSSSFLQFPEANDASLIERPQQLAEHFVVYRCFEKWELGKMGYLEKR